LIFFSMFTRNNITGNQNGLCRDQEASRTSGSHCIPQICNSQLRKIIIGGPLTDNS
jgi:hypothetical protein